MLNKRKKFHLSFQEKTFFNRICTLSGQNSEIVKDVLQGILIAITMSLFSFENSHEKDENKKCEFVLPYIGKFNFEYYERRIKGQESSLISDIKIEPCKILQDELKSIVAKKYPPTTDFFLKEIAEKIRKIIELNEPEEFLKLLEFKGSE